jgi:hypothetical protein
MAAPDEYLRRYRGLVVGQMAGVNEDIGVGRKPSARSRCTRLVPRRSPIPRPPLRVGLAAAAQDILAPSGRSDSGLLSDALSAQAVQPGAARPPHNVAAAPGSRLVPRRSPFRGVPPSLRSIGPPRVPRAPRPFSPPGDSRRSAPEPALTLVRADAEGTSFLRACLASLGRTPGLPKLAQLRAPRLGRALSRGPSDCEAPAMKTREG